MGAMAPQNPPVFRDPFAPDRPEESEDHLELAGGTRTFGSIQASQSRCDALRGPARSLCYAGLYGVSV